MRSVLAIFVLSLAVLGVAGCSSGRDGAYGPSAGRQQAGPPATPVSASELIEAYRANEAKADALYKGKTLAVTGVVSGKGKDFTNQPYVELKGDNPIIEVHCNYADSGDEAMSALKDGQQVTIRGVCAGRLSTWVILKESEVQQ